MTQTPRVEFLENAGPPRADHEFVLSEISGYGRVSCSTLSFPQRDDLELIEMIGSVFYAIFFVPYTKNRSSPNIGVSITKTPAVFA